MMFLFDKNELLSRLKNRVTLSLFLSVVFAVLVNLGLVDVGFVQRNQELINVIVGILAGIGVLRNPYGERR